MTAPIPPLSLFLVEPIVRAALAEDLGRAGDITSDAVVPAHARARGAIVARAPGRVAGLDAALMAFRLLDPAVRIGAMGADGDDVAPGTVLARMEGLARPMLSAERTALNLLGRLSGVASATARAVAAVRGTRARVAGTRKTTPGLRALEKYAVRVGGGRNHRFGLDDAILIKDNHIAAVGGLEPAVARARAAVGHMVKIEVEVDTLAQLRELLPLGADAVLLDNMTVAELRAAVALVDGAMMTEASGGLTPETIAEVAASGVDIVSLGWLTHGAGALDIGLDMEPG